MKPAWWVLGVWMVAGCAGARQSVPPPNETPPPPAAEVAPGERESPSAISEPPSNEGAPRPEPREVGPADAAGSAAVPEVPSGLRADVPAPDTYKRLDFRSGDPILPIRLMEGRDEVTFAGRGRLRMRVAGAVEKTIEAPAGTSFSVRITGGRPAEVSAAVQLAEFPFADKEGLAAEQQRWTERGVATRVHTLGTVYGIAGKVIDNRRYLLLLEGSFSPDEAKRRQADLLREHSTRTQLFEQLVKPATGILEVLDSDGSVVAVGEGKLTVEVIDGRFIDVEQVEFGVGYDFHSFEDRTYRGALQLLPDRNGKLAVVNLVSLEELLNGLVPAEIFARSHPEALKAQAVTARGEVLAKIGTKHLADPYLLCSEQHCAVYKGLSGEAASTNAAVAATHGEGLFSQDGRLVDSVYSAVCGGHTENNEFVWGGVANPSLRGRPDVIRPTDAPSPTEDLEGFLAEKDLPAACRLSTLTSPNKFRWEKRIPAEKADAMVASLGIGHLLAISVNERGVSGRAKLITLSGDQGATQLRGELNIRRLFGMLNSAMFLVHSEPGPDGRPAVWIFRGGGWGHGVGMCQTGAIGRAQAGHGYREILRHYYNGAEVAPIY